MCFISLSTISSKPLLASSACLGDWKIFFQRKNINSSLLQSKRKEMVDPAFFLGSQTDPLKPSFQKTKSFSIENLSPCNILHSTPTTHPARAHTQTHIYGFICFSYEFDTLI